MAADKYVQKKEPGWVGIDDVIRKAFYGANASINKHIDERRYNGDNIKTEYAAESCVITHASRGAAACAFAILDCTKGYIKLRSKKNAREDKSFPFTARIAVFSYVYKKALRSYAVCIDGTRYPFSWYANADHEIIWLARVPNEAAEMVYNGNLKDADLDVPAMYDYKKASIIESVCDRNVTYSNKTFRDEWETIATGELHYYRPNHSYDGKRYVIADNEPKYWKDVFHKKISSSKFEIKRLKSGRVRLECDGAFADTLGLSRIILWFQESVDRLHCLSIDQFPTLDRVFTERHRHYYANQTYIKAMTVSNLKVAEMLRTQAVSDRIKTGRN
jgi:hypothetical protein